MGPKKVYIAGKITGDPDYYEKFKEAEEHLQNKGYLVMNPAILPEGFEWHEYMGICVAMLAACDHIYMLDVWESSNGANEELKIAQARKYTILYQKPPVDPKSAQKTPNKNND